MLAEEVFFAVNMEKISFAFYICTSDVLILYIYNKKNKFIIINIVKSPKNKEREEVK